MKDDLAPNDCSRVMNRDGVPSKDSVPQIEDTGISSQVPSDVVHELNNLLFVILGNAELMLIESQEGLSEDSRRSLRDIIKCGERGIVLIRQLYDLPGKNRAIESLLSAATDRGDECRPDDSLCGDETILVCDDETVILDSSASLLECRGYSVIRAGSAHDAIKAAESHDGEIDLLLTDVTMPDMSGWQLAERLIEQQPRMKVIFMSGHAADTLETKAFEGDSIEFIEKPPMGDTLFRRIRDVLDGRTKPAV